MAKASFHSEKLPNLLEKIKECISEGNYKFSNHAFERKAERLITVPDILFVLNHGYHEKRKDHWNEKNQTWNYSIRGKDFDGELIRIIVSFQENNMLIITVIRLN